MLRLGPRVPSTLCCVRRPVPGPLPLRPWLCLLKAAALGLPHKLPHCPQPEAQAGREGLRSPEEGGRPQSTRASCPGRSPGPCCPPAQLGFRGTHLRGGNAILGALRTPLVGAWSPGWQSLEGCGPEQQKLGDKQ